MKSNRAKYKPIIQRVRNKISGVYSVTSLKCYMRAGNSIRDLPATLTRVYVKMKELCHTMTAFIYRYRIHTVCHEYMTMQLNLTLRRILYKVKVKETGTVE